ncbi:MAG: aldo/keto reductase [Anaerolineae bacterium]|nr:aldo/keto reductase [Anaerolineae bacterium]
MRRNTEQNWAVLDMVNQIAAGHPGSTAAQVSIAWLLTRPTVASVIVGARSLKQLKDNLLAADLHLTEDELARLNAVSAYALPYPYRMINTTAR